MNKASINTIQRLKAKRPPLKVERSLVDRVKKTADRVESLFSDLPKHINAAIKADHDDLRGFIKTLKDTDQEMKVRRQAYAQFASLLQSHSEAEEKAVYLKVKRLPEAELKIKVAEGFAEHFVAAELMNRISSTRDATNWSGLTNVLAELLEHHLDEEERDMMPLIDEQMDQKLNQRMLKEYLDLRGSTQKKVGKKNAGVLKGKK